MTKYKAETGLAPEEYFRTQNPGSGPFDFHDLSGPWRFLFPGFIDTHIHALQYPNVGIGSELPLLDWLKNYTFELENKFMGDKERHYAFSSQVYNKVIDKTLSNGTTCASYFTTIDTDTTKMFAELLVAKGQRGFVGKVCMNCNPTYPEYVETADECIAGNEAMIAHCKQLQECAGFAPNFTVKPIVTPRFAPSCLRELMARLGQMARAEDLPIQTHISENLAEIQLVHDTFPECDSYSQVYDAYQLLTPRTILAHGIHLQPQERQLLAQRQCSISHCPTSNTFITSGEAPVRRYLYDDGINVGLGTDVSGGYEQSILGVVKALILVSHHLSMKSPTGHRDSISMADALYMSTMGGARACGMEAHLGSFAPGKSFDAQLVDLQSSGSNIDVFDFQRPEAQREDYEQKMLQLLQKWVFSGDDRNCTIVWCNGRVVVKK